MSSNNVKIVMLPGATDFSAEIVQPDKTRNSKSEVRVNISHGSRDQEIENIKRLLANISQRLDALK